ncbi:hypothetical protein U9M48_029320, partial [Paspalum notatum var. saurae]
HVNEERTRELPVIEEPDDREPEGQPREEYPQATSTSPPRRLTLVRKVWSSSFVPAWVEELVTTRSEPSHDRQWGDIGGHDVTLLLARLLFIMNCDL